MFDENPPNSRRSFVRISVDFLMELCYTYKRKGVAESENGTPDQDVESPFQACAAVVIDVGMHAMSRESGNRPLHVDE